MYFHPMNEYTYYRWSYANNQRWCDRSASHFGRFAPQTRPLRCAICTIRCFRIFYWFYNYRRTVCTRRLDILVLRNHKSGKLEIWVPVLGNHLFVLDELCISISPDSWWKTIRNIHRSKISFLGNSIISAKTTLGETFFLFAFLSHYE